MKRHPGLWLTIFLAIFFILLGNDRITSGDGETMFQVTRALVQQGRLNLPTGILPPVEKVPISSTDTQIPYTLAGHDGHTYSKYGLGQSLAAMPLYLLGVAWWAVTGSVHAPRTAALLLNSLLTASTAGLLLILAQDLRYSARTGITLALAFAVCSPAWVYTHTFFSEPLVTFCLTCAAVAAVRFAQKSDMRWLVLMGGALGLALLTRIAAVAALPAFSLYIVLTWRAQHTPFHIIVRQIAGTLIAFCIGVGLMLLYNLVRSGTPFDFGYHTSNWQTPFFQGLYGLTLSPGKGLLWYAPVVLLGLIGFRSFARRWPREALMCGGVLIGYLLLHSVYTYWEGGWSWGPRLVLPALPFAILPAGAIVNRRHLPQLAELGLALVLVWGLLVQIPAVGGNYAHTLQQVYISAPEEFQTRVLFQPAYTPLIGQWQNFLGVTANLRNPQARAQIADLLAQAQPDDVLLLADTRAEALRLQRQTILAFNLPDLWLVSGPWLRQETAP